jgi:hypothetical protein
MYGLRSAAHIELLLWGPVNRRTGNDFWDFVQSLSAMFPILSVLSKAGCKITVKLRNICEFDVKSEELSVKGKQRDNGKSSMISLSLLINLLMNIGYSVNRAPHTCARPNLSKPYPGYLHATQ